MEYAAFIPRKQEERPEGRPEDTLETKTQPYTARQGSPEDTLNTDHTQRSKGITVIMSKPEDALYKNNLELPELTEEMISKFRSFLRFHNTKFCVVTRDNCDSNPHGTPLSFELIHTDSSMDQPFPGKRKTNTSQP